MPGGHNKFERRHYEAIAKVLADNRPLDMHAPECAIWSNIMEGFVREFRQDNPRFKVSRFLIACDVRGKEAA
jgi:hypothetical protein